MVVAEGMNGVTPELRDFALRKVRRAVRRGRLSSIRTLKALPRGDAGIGSLFDPAALPSAPTLPVESAVVVTPSKRKLIAQGLWYVEHALRRGVATSDDLSRLSDPLSSDLEAAELMLRIWNDLLASYAPAWAEWTPSASESRCYLTALPSCFKQGASGQIVIEPNSISRQFVNADHEDFPEVSMALKRLCAAQCFHLMLANATDGREFYNEYSLGFELAEDVRQAITWPDGAETPLVLDPAGLERLAEEHGYEGETGTYLSERVIQQMVFERNLSRRIAALDAATPRSKVAARIHRYADHLESLPCKKAYADIGGAGLPVVLVATFDGDIAGDDIANAIDCECQEEGPTVTISELASQASSLDKQLERLVAELVIAEAVYADIFENC